MLKEIIISVQSFFEAHRFIVKNKLWKWIIVPGIIYCILFSIGIYFFGITSYKLVQLILMKTGVKAWLESMQDSWLNLLVIVGQGIIMGVLFLFYFSEGFCLAHFLHWHGRITAGGILLPIKKY